ncbi:hypothetical protein PF002_g11505 [Phytophthora fragariae]|uniref:Uncharacterized protein n=1 Tax=Phytophthora fragariae TaxID=53985 RepID=A0A6A4DSM4_9STRA|nr:hypothetical protein PF011_g9022 [Phytophthora fragariae]KAE9114613.1 hypothetical protein PF007_g10316 [Phytophthora fragariae]KAE9145669.1 hypothetical protein PF006_g9503 [Phytophthora fragariae]KAE9235551.1 hypothetical protein PF002_g11505 [Phytophthora fragariae]KAE9312006.1 hypothetical protein PF001_g9459 [Phytophthora fragariae]
MRALRRLCNGIFEVWMYLQVELHGSYSIYRMRLLNNYTSSTSALRASIFLAMAPFPCLAILTLIDCVPLAPTESGYRANFLFWGRNCLTISLMTRAILEQLHLTVPSLHFTTWRTLSISVIPSAGSVAFMLAMTSLIGFPLPFTLVVGIPVWFLGLVICFGIFFGAKLRREAALRKELLNYIVVIACQVVLTFIYPAYLYGFRAIDSTAQTFYVLLLPIIKIATKNWISLFLGSKDDLKPQVVILNIEVFNALYVASSMQNATSITTTLALMLVDFVLAWISIKDVNHFLVGITSLLDKIPADHPLKTANFVEVALQMLDEDAQLKKDVSLRYFSVHHYPDAPKNKKARVHLDPTSDERTEYIQKTAQVLFTAEFIVLIEFTEVIIPFIYSIYTIAMFELPNRVFYPQIRALDRTSLFSMLGNIAIYDREWRMVQSNLFLWICYTIQNSLDHNGADFSWQFSWLKNAHG